MPNIQPWGPRLIYSSWCFPASCMEQPMAKASTWAPSPVFPLDTQVSNTLTTLTLYCIHLWPHDLCCLFSHRGYLVFVSTFSSHGHIICLFPVSLTRNLDYEARVVIVKNGVLCSVGTRPWGWGKWRTGKKKKRIFIDRPDLFCFFKDRLL